MGTIRLKCMLGFQESDGLKLNLYERSGVEDGSD